MPYFGDSYGGVQAAQQAGTNSDRNFLMSLLAAQQQAQRMAMDQQNIAASRDQNWALNQQQMAQQANMFNVNAEMAEQDRQMREDMGLANLDLQESKIVATRDLYARKLQKAEEEKFRQAGTAGPLLASRFAELIGADQSSDAELRRVEQEALKLEQELAANLSQGFIKVKKGQKNVFEAGESKDPDMKAKAEMFNASLREKELELKRLIDSRKKAAQDLAQHMRIIQSSGFILDQNQLVYPKTGQPFPLQAPQATQNSPRIFGRVDPQTGALIRK